MFQLLFSTVEELHVGKSRKGGWILAAVVAQSCEHSYLRSLSLLLCLSLRWLLSTGPPPLFLVPPVAPAAPLTSAEPAVEAVVAFRLRGPRVLARLAGSAGLTAAPSSLKTLGMGTLKKYTF